MIIRACCDMAAGAQVTFWYHNPSTFGEGESQNMHNHWGFNCECAICMDARSTDAVVLGRRQKLLVDMKGVFSSQFDIKKVERLIEAIGKTYTQPAKDVPRLLLWEPQLCVLRFYATQRMASKTMQSALKVLAFLGFVIIGADSSRTPFAIVKWGFMEEHLVEVFFDLRNAFIAMGAEKDSLHAEGYARTAYKILIGEDASFDATYEL